MWWSCNKTKQFWKEQTDLYIRTMLIWICGSCSVIFSFMNTSGGFEWTHKMEWVPTFFRWMEGVLGLEWQLVLHSKGQNWNLLQVLFCLVGGWRLWSCFIWSVREKLAIFSFSFYWGFHSLKKEAHFISEEKKMCSFEKDKLKYPTSSCNVCYSSGFHLFDLWLAFSYVIWYSSHSCFPLSSYWISLCICLLCNWICFLNRLLRFCTVKSVGFPPFLFCCCFEHLPLSLPCRFSAYYFLKYRILKFSILLWFFPQGKMCLSQFAFILNIHHIHHSTDFSEICNLALMFHIGI